MKGVVITSERVQDSAHKLAAALGWQVLYDYEKYTPDMGHVIFYGTSIKKDVHIPYAPFVAILNHPDNVKHNTDKHSSITTLYNSGIPVPLTIPANQILHALKTGHAKLPILARTAQHTCGEGLWVCLQPSDIDITLKWGANHYVEHIQIMEEYRAYMYKDKLVKTVRKVADYSARMNLIVRNNDNGWNFELVKDATPEIETVSKKAMLAMHLDIASVDLARTINGDLVVFELNTGSWMSKHTATLYAELIKADLEKPTPSDEITLTPVVVTTSPEQPELIDDDVELPQILNSTPTEPNILQKLLDEIQNDNAHLPNLPPNTNERPMPTLQNTIPPSTTSMV